MYYFYAVQSSLYIREPSWSLALQEFTRKPDWFTIQRSVEECYSKNRCYPPKEKILQAFNLTPLNHVNVVILGQDPYHGAGQANGLAFSVSMGQKPPPSLRNILKEVWEDVAGMPWVDLSRWAEQGVFLLNAVLTVEEKKPGSHTHFGWENFSDEVISVISRHREHVVFMLWGQYAQRKAALIDSQKHLILTAPHPSPLSAYQGFLGCKHFSRANEYLSDHSKPVIHW